MLIIDHLILLLLVIGYKKDSYATNYTIMPINPDENFDMAFLEKDSSLLSF